MVKMESLSRSRRSHQHETVSKQTTHQTSSSSFSFSSLGDYESPSALSPTLLLKRSSRYALLSLWMAKPKSFGSNTWMGSDGTNSGKWIKNSMGKEVPKKQPSRATMKGKREGPTRPLLIARHVDVLATGTVVLDCVLSEREFPMRSLPRLV